VACISDCTDVVCPGCVNKTIVVKVMSTGRQVQSPGAGRY
jgi:hypothetical protein